MRDYQRKIERRGQGKVKLTKKSFMELQNRLMPIGTKKMEAIEFINMSKLCKKVGNADIVTQG